MDTWARCQTNMDIGVWRVHPKHITDLLSVTRDCLWVVGGGWRRFGVVSKLDQGDRKRK